MAVTDEELASLASSHDIISIGALADEARRRRHGLRTTYVRVATVPCEPGAAIDIPPAAGEVRIVGNPASQSAAIARVSAVAVRAAGRPLSAFSLADLESLATHENVSLRRILEDLRAGGLELVAEAPFDLLANPQAAIEEVNIAGLTLARLTVDDVTTGDFQRLLRDVAAVQRKVAVIRAFAPLPQHINPAAPTTGYDDVKRVALARIYVDNVPSIQVDWSRYGPKLAQVALTVGADDVDGVSAVDEVSEGRRRSPLEEIRRNIQAAGFEPVERNGRFDVLTR